MRKNKRKSFLKNHDKIRSSQVSKYQSSMSNEPQRNKVSSYVTICYKCLSIWKEIFFLIYSLNIENRIVHTNMNTSAISDHDAQFSVVRFT